MNLEEKNVVTINWKKIFKIGITFMASVIVIRLVVFTLFFNEARKFVSDFNTGFNRGQRTISNKIDADWEKSIKNAKHGINKRPKEIWNSKK